MSNSAPIRHPVPVRDAVVVDAHDTCEHVAGLMTAYGADHAVVCGSGGLAGTVAASVVAEVVGRDRASQAHVCEFVDSAVSIDAGSSAEEACRLMSYHQVKVLAVMRGRQCVGVVTSEDALAAVERDAGAEFSEP